MPNWKKVLVSGSDASIRQLTLGASGTTYSLPSSTGSLSEALIVQSDGNLAFGSIVGALNDGVISSSQQITDHRFINEVGDSSITGSFHVSSSAGDIGFVTNNDFNVTTTGKTTFRGREFGNLVESTQVDISGSLYVNGISVFKGGVAFGDNEVDDIGVADFITFRSHINSNIIPSSSGDFDLGSGSLKWRTLHIENIESSGSLVHSGSSALHGNITNVRQIYQDRNERETFIGYNAGINARSETYNVGIGYQVLENLTSGSRNVAIGFESLEELIEGDYNIGLGFRAGRGITNGNHNTYLGVLAGSDTTGGTRRDNTGIGYRSGEATTTGDYNTTVGSLAGYQMTTGDQNTFVGWRAGGALTTGNRNVALGANADWVVMNGDDNTVLGYNTRLLQTNDSHSIVIGSGVAGRGDGTTTIGSTNTVSTKLYGSLEIDGITNVSQSIAQALSGDITLPANTVSSSAQTVSNLSGSRVFVDSIQVGQPGDYVTTVLDVTGSLDVSGSFNINGNIESVGRISTHDGMRSVFVGNGAGEKEDPGFFYNTGIGFTTLGEIGSGERNTGLGFQSIGFTTTGDDNIGIGYFAGLGVITGVQNIFIGSEAGGGNYSEGGDRQANVGIGHNALRLTSTADNNTAVGALAGRNITTGGFNAFFGWRAGGSATVGINNVALGANAGWANMDGNNNILVGYNTATSQSADNNSIVIGSSEVGRGSNTTTIGNDNITSTKIYGTLEIDGIANVSQSIADIEAGDITLPEGVISSSAQIDALFDIDGLVSSSTQVISHLPAGTVSSSNQIASEISGSFTELSSSLQTRVANIETGATPAATSSLALTASLLDGRVVPTTFSSDDNLNIHLQGQGPGNREIGTATNGNFYYNPNTDVLGVPSISASTNVHIVGGLSFATPQTIDFSAGLGGAITSSDVLVKNNFTVLGVFTAQNLNATASKAESILTSSFVEGNDLPVLLGFDNNGDGYANPALDASNFTYNGDRLLVPAFSSSGDGTIDGDLNVIGTINAEAIHTTYVTSSVSFYSSSNKFGDEASDVHEFTGSLEVSHGANIQGTLISETSVELNGPNDSRLILDRNANSNDSEVEFRTNGSLDWSVGTGQVGGDRDFTFRASDSSNAVRIDQNANIHSLGSVNALHVSASSTISGSSLFIKTDAVVGGDLTASAFSGDGSGLTGITADSVLFSNVTNKPALISSSNQLEGFVSQSAAFVANEFIVANGANSITSSNLLSVDMTEQRIGIGTTSPTVKLDIVGETGGEAQMRLAQHDNSSDGPDMRFFKSRGTEDSPAAVNADDYIGAVNAFSYDGSNYQQSGFFGFQSLGTGGEANFSIKTRLDGAFPDRLTIDGEGDVHISGDLYAPTITGSLFRLSENGQGMRLTNVGGFENYSGTFNIFSNNDVFLRAGGASDSFAVATLHQSNQRAEFHGQVSASLFSGSFVGDGSSITGVSADSIDFDNVTNKPTLVSSSNQIGTAISGAFDELSGSIANRFDGLTSDYTELTNIPSGIISSSAQIDNLFDIDGLVSSSTQVVDHLPSNTVSSSTQVVNFLPAGTISGSAQIDEIVNIDGIISSSDQFTDLAAPFTGSFTGSFTGDGSGLTGVGSVSNGILFGLGLLGGTYNGVLSVTSSLNTSSAHFQEGAAAAIGSSSFASRLDTFEGKSLLSSSAQIDFTQITNTAGIVSSSTQVVGHLPSNTVSSSAQVVGFLPAGTISGSAQIATDISGAFDSVSASLATDISDITNGDTAVTSASNALTASIAQALELTNVDMIDQQFTFALINTASNSIASYDTEDLTFNPNTGELEITGLTVTNFSIAGGNTGQGTILAALTASLAVDATNAVNANTASLADEITLTTMPAMVNTYYPTFTPVISDRGTVIVTSSIYYDRPNETLYAPNFSGSFTGNIETATTASYVDASAVTNVTTYRETVSGATSYTITHNLNEQYPIVQAWNTSNNQMEIPASITSDNVNEVTVDFGLPFAGQIIVKI